MNPYQPPKTKDLAAPEDPKPAVLRSQKMPASHKWAIVCFVPVAAVNIYLNTRGLLDTLGVLATLTSLAGIVGILFFRRSPRTYTVGVIGLGFVLLRTAQSVFLRVHEQFLGVGPGWLMLGLLFWILFLIILLFRAYTIGATSRQYYGFPATPKSGNA